MPRLSLSVLNRPSIQRLNERCTNVGTISTRSKWGVLMLASMLSITLAGCSNTNNDASDSNAASTQAVTDSVQTKTSDTAPMTASTGTIDGAQVYAQRCIACHKEGLLNAPKINDTTAWRYRKKQGIDVLYAHSINGYERMPAQAVDGVSEAQVRAAVDYMLEQAEAQAK